MSAGGGVTAARRQAAALLAELGDPGPPIDPFAIADAWGILVEAKPPEADGVSGMLLRVGQDFMIVYATHVAGVGFQRFSVAHELGHYFLPGHCDQLLAAGAHVSRAGGASTDPYEREADAFAACLLVPPARGRAAVRGCDGGLAAVLAISDVFSVSLTCAALRACDLVREPFAVIVSHHGSVEFCLMNEAMKPHARRGWPRRGDGLPVGVAASSLASDLASVTRCGRVDARTDLRTWFDCERRVDALEESVGLGDWGRVLTVLTAEADEDLDEADDEAGIIESWTPRFR